MPLLADGLDRRSVFGDLDEVGPDEQARRQHGGDADSRERGQRDLELGALGLVVRFVACAGAEAPDAIGGEEIDRNEDDAADPKGDVDGEVDRAPVRGEWREVPGAREMENQRANNEQDDDDCKSHHTSNTPQNIRRTICRRGPNVLKKRLGPPIAGSYSMISFPFINTKWPGNEQKYV